MEQSLDLRDGRIAVVLIMALPILTALIIVLVLATHGAFAPGLWAPESH